MGTGWKRKVRTGMTSGKYLMKAIKCNVINFAAWFFLVTLLNSTYVMSGARKLIGEPFACMPHVIAITCTPRRICYKAYLPNYRV